MELDSDIVSMFFRLSSWHEDKELRRGLFYKNSSTTGILYLLQRKLLVGVHNSLVAVHYLSTPS